MFYLSHKPFSAFWCPLALQNSLGMSQTFLWNFPRAKKCPLSAVPYKPYCVYNHNYRALRVGWLTSMPVPRRVCGSGGRLGWWLPLASRPVSERRSSWISRADVVLKVSSSCCAAVPVAKYTGETASGDQATLAVSSISFTFIPGLDGTGKRVTGHRRFDSQSMRRDVMSNYQDR